jgi:tRNA (guanine-N7-)-methyltransferase
MIDATPYTIEYPTLTPPIRWADLFGNDHPVEVEIGSGKGLFLTNAAQRRPRHNFLGIENAKKYAYKSAGRVAKLELANVRVLPGDALLFMAKYAPPESLCAAHVYFPDPWWKARHKKRRVFGEPLVLDLERTLLAGGDLHVVTDVEEYFGVIRALMATHPRFEPQPEPAPNTPEHDDDYLTNFERKYRIEGRPIYRAHYRFG